MIQELEPDAREEWLCRLDEGSIRCGPLPLRDLLHGCLYYPSCGFDGTPVKYLAGNVLSFVYVDYGRTPRDLQDQLTTRGFRGYDVIAGRDLTPQDVVPGRWTPTILPGKRDGDPHRARITHATPWARWIVFQRRPGFDDAHGPKRFSLIYVCAEGAAAFDALFLANRLAPRAIAIIQPGTGFGGNWTDFCDPTKILHRLVEANSAGLPELLLYGGIGDADYYVQPCWLEFKNLLRLIRRPEQTVGIWRRDTGTTVQSVSG